MPTIIILSVSPQPCSRPLARVFTTTFTPWQPHRTLRWPSFFHTPSLCVIHLYLAAPSAWEHSNHTGMESGRQFSLYPCPSLYLFQFHAQPYRTCVSTLLPFPGDFSEPWCGLNFHIFCGPSQPPFQPSPIISCLSPYLEKVSTQDHNSQTL